jgi:hypothetical protein
VIRGPPSPTLEQTALAWPLISRLARRPPVRSVAARACAWATNASCRQWTYPAPVGGASSCGLLPADAAAMVGVHKSGVGPGHPVPAKVARRPSHACSPIDWSSSEEEAPSPGPPLPTGAELRPQPAPIRHPWCRLRHSSTSSTSSRASGAIGPVSSALAAAASTQSSSTRTRFGPTTRRWRVLLRPAPLRPVRQGAERRPRGARRHPPSVREGPEGSIRPGSRRRWTAGSSGSTRESR